MNAANRMVSHPKNLFILFRKHTPHEIDTGYFFLDQPETNTEWTGSLSWYITEDNKLIPLPVYQFQYLNRRKITTLIIGQLFYHMKPHWGVILTFIFNQKTVQECTNKVFVISTTTWKMEQNDKEDKNKQK